MIDDVLDRAESVLLWLADHPALSFGFLIVALAVVSYLLSEHM